jgi:D-alanyl-D-alanine dipeptidase
MKPCHHLLVSYALDAFVLICSLNWQAAIAAPPQGFQDVTALEPSIQVEMRYASSWNFMGRKIQGYSANKCYLSKQAAQALALVQRDLKAKQLGLLALDCYRPKRAVAEFVRWTNDPKDDQMKEIYYPDEQKSDLISRGYISDKSGHSRGSTIDLTVINLQASAKLKGRWPVLRFKEEKVDCRKQVNINSTTQLDMGTMFDCFSVLANTYAPEIKPTAKKNRKILLDAMEKRGFTNYDKEWWHFTLKDEPFKDTYFDTPID